LSPATYYIEKPKPDKGNRYHSSEVKFLCVTSVEISTTASSRKKRSAGKRTTRRKSMTSNANLLHLPLPHLLALKS
jgi:hypothetical protein